MAYRLKAGESIPDGIRRVVGEEIESAVDLLRKEQISQRDEAVHEARKSIKKIRGVLRLMRPQLGSTYKQENTRFRDIGRQLSELRDAAALLEVFDQLAEKLKDVLDAKGLRTIRRGIEKDKAETEQRLDAAKVVRQAMSTLRSAQGRLAKWPLETDGFGAVASGLGETYRRGRKALKLAQKRDTPVAYHDFRKRVKDHWYHVRLLESVWTDVMEAHEKSLKELETWLGDDHNLVVLREKIEQQPGRYGGKAVLSLFLPAIKKHQAELRERARALGEKVYRDKPAVFVDGVNKLWKIWHREPESVEDISQFQPAPTRKASGKKPSARARNVG